jgi:hypothetical protein
MFVPTRSLVSSPAVQVVEDGRASLSVAQNGATLSTVAQSAPGRYAERSAGRLLTNRVEVDITTE